MLLVSPDWDFPGASVVKNLPANTRDEGDKGSISGMGKSPRGGTGQTTPGLLPGNPRDKGAWQSGVRGASKSWTQLSN